MKFYACRFVYAISNFLIYPKFYENLLLITATEEKLFLFSVIPRGKSYFKYKQDNKLIAINLFFFFFLQMNRKLFINDFFQNYIKPGWVQFLKNVYRNKQVSSWVSISLRFDGRFPKGSHVTKTFLQIHYKAILFFFLLLASLTDPNFWHFEKENKTKQKTKQRRS